MSMLHKRLKITETRNYTLSLHNFQNLPDYYKYLETQMIKCQFP